MKGISIVLLQLLTGLIVYCQPTDKTTNSYQVRVLKEDRVPVEGATVSYIQAGRLIKAALTDPGGLASFENIPAGTGIFQVSFAGYAAASTAELVFPITTGKPESSTITLQPAPATLQNISVNASKPFIRQSRGKVIVNPDASSSNAGTTVLELLEKSPGLLVDKNGSISMKGKTGVLVLIDDKPTYLSGTELANLLGSMSSGQVDQLELMANPPAKYDASGNAGVINIKTKKNRQKGFNGSFTTSAGHGRYPKSNNSLLLNFRKGKINTFLTYSMNYNKYLTDIYALRKYYDAGRNVTAVLDQPTFYKGRGINNTLRTGLDFSASPKTTIGMTLTGVLVNRQGTGDAAATWLDPAGNVDSSIFTYTTSSYDFRNGAVNVSLKQEINSKQQLSVDLDWLNYDIGNWQFFNNSLLSPGGYSEASQGDIPAAIQILSGKADHSLHLGRDGKLETGWKSSHISTNNKADYRFFDAGQWAPDYGKSNHFKYRENIHALYSSLEQKHAKWAWQLGIRYEYTQYEARQLGNLQQADSSFSRNYHGLFPTGYLSYELDSSHSFTITAGRRIDRPAFQKLNPFVFIINKYTHQRGNPYFLPQYTWNVELGHQFKQLLTTTVSYSYIKNYFSQLFLTEPDVLIYTEGNVGRMHNLGISTSLQTNPFKWWTLSGQVMWNYKKLEGYQDKSYNSSIKQFNLGMNNQFRINKIYSAELSGFYTGRARNDLQELLYPTGQLSVGLSRPVLKNKGTLKCNARDLFYTQAMEGLTDFENAEEYFILKRDSRVITVAFTYRFGKAYKTTRRSGGSATAEMERVGNGN